MGFSSPLRYPGGKRKLSSYFSRLIIANRLDGGTYIEPYAGGAGLALALLFDDVVGNIVINDLNPSIYNFWKATIGETDELCELILDVPVSVEEWKRQKMVQHNPKASTIELALSTFFLNRVNRSGILDGGLIGGNKQNGAYKMDARFNKPELINRIRRIGEARDRITVLNMDAEHMIESYIGNYSSDASIVYLDPPYYQMGAEMYMTHYRKSDHAELARKVATLPIPWVVSYDNAPEIHSLYGQFRRKTFQLSHTAGVNHKGTEVMIFSDELMFPLDVELPEEREIC